MTMHLIIFVDYCMDQMKCTRNTREGVIFKRGKVSKVKLG